MKKNIRYIGLDVHAETIAVAVSDKAGEAQSLGRYPTGPRRSLTVGGARNPAIVLCELFALWVPFALGSRNEVVVALDWTEHDHDDQSTIALNLITSHGRATPL